MACNAPVLMVPIVCISLYFVTIWHVYCVASPLYDHTNAEGLYEQSLLSKHKAGKHHAPPSAHLMHPPPPTALFKSPPRPGQVPLSAVESEAAFTLYYGRNFKVVQNLFYNFTYLLLEQVGDSNGRDWDLNISVFQDPLMNFTIDTSSVVGFLELLGCVSKLRGVPASFGLASPCILQLISQGEIPTIESDDNLTDPNAVSSNISFEAVIGSSTKYVNVQLTGNEQNQSNYISFDSSMDRGPLQRAEWIKFLASFFNLEERANTVFGQIYSSYQCLNASSKGGNTSKPLVAWLSYNADLGVWTFSDDPYKLQLILDAGGLNLDLSNLSISFNMSIESNIDNFHNIASSLDVVIDETYAPDPSAYTWGNLTTAANISDVNKFPFLANKRLWRSDKRIGINNALDWMEGAIAQPQVVLRDLIEVFYPVTDDRKAYNTTYFRNIAMDESFVNTTTLPCPYTNMTNDTVLQPTIIPCTIDSIF